MISVIVYGRNDSHGYNLPKRAALSFNCIAEVLTHPDDEIVFVDCNTPDDLPTFPESIADTLTPRARELMRVLRLRPASYEKGKRGATFKVLEPLCRNVGIRRTNPANRWVLNTNTDMVFTPLLSGKSLSDVIADLADGFYELPRFEVPEILWETMDRQKPREIIEAFARWGHRLHLNEVVHNAPEILFDGPGDFQLALRSQLFAIHGMDERMTLGWHVDSNLCKRMFLLNGETKSLLDRCHAYHCDHTRLNTPYHSAAESTSNDWRVFFRDVLRPELPEQAETWGLPGEPVEEFRLTEQRGARYVRILEELLPGTRGAMTCSAIKSESFNHGLLYETRHILPYVTDHLTMISPADDFAYVGGNLELVRLVVAFRKGYGHTGRVLFDAEVMARGGHQGQSLPEGCVPLSFDSLLGRGRVFCFDFWMGQFPHQKNRHGFEVSTPSETAGGFAALLLRRMHEFACAEKAGFGVPGRPPRKSLFLGTQNTWAEYAVTQLFGVVMTPYSSYTRHGFVRKDALEKLLEPVPGHHMFLADSPRARVDHLTKRLGRNVVELELLKAELFFAELAEDGAEAAQARSWSGRADFELKRAVLEMSILLAELQMKFDLADRLRTVLAGWEWEEDVASSSGEEGEARPASNKRTVKAAKQSGAARVAVDARLLASDGNASPETRDYVVNHLTALITAQPAWQFVLLRDADSSGDGALQPLLAHSNVKSALIAESAAGDFDLLFIPDAMHALDREWLPRLWPEVPVIVMLHELCGLRHYYRGWTPPEKSRYLERLDDIGQRADRVLTSTRFLKRDFSRCTGLAENRIEEVLGGWTCAPSSQPIPPARREAVLTRHGIRKPFFLHVGAGDPHKNLRAAFLSCARLPEGAAQLVLVGRKEGDLKQLAEKAAASNSRHIIFTGELPREDLEVLYREATVLLLPSIYEGFSLPLVDAMARGCPVVSSNAPGTVEVAGEASARFYPDDIPALAKGLARLLEDATLREGWAARGRTRAVQLTWAETGRRTLRVMEAVLRGEPSAGEATQSVGGDTIHNKSLSTGGAPTAKGHTPRWDGQVVWIAPWQNSSGYATEALSFAHGVDEHLKLELVEAAKHKSSEYVGGLPPEQRNWLRSKLRGRVQLAGKVVIQHLPGSALSHYPNAAYHIARTMFETDRLPSDWVDRCNLMDEVWVPSHFNLETFVAAGVARDKLVLVPGTVDERVFDPRRHEPLALPRRAGFNFLFVAQWYVRKGWDALLASYLSEFSASDDVCLYLRVFLPTLAQGTTREVVRAAVRETAAKLKLGHKPLPRVEILADEIAPVDLPRLYKAVDCLVAPSRGEGWGRPLHEAMLMELPVIGTNWSANTEFMNPANSYLLDYELVEAAPLEREQSHVLGHRWAEPSGTHLRQLMRRVFEQREEGRERGRIARANLVKNFGYRGVSEWIRKRLGVVERILSERAAGAIKVAAVAPDTHSAKLSSDHEGKNSVREGVHQEASSAVTPADRVGATEAVSESIALAWEGSFLDHGSLSHVNRQLTVALERQPGVSLARLTPSPSGAGHGAVHSFSELAAKLQTDAPADTRVTVRHAWPPRWKRPARGAWVLMQPWEFGSLPRDWVRQIEAVDEVWAYTEYVRQVYLASGVPEAKVKIVPCGIDPEKFRPGLAPLPLATRKTFKFLFVGGTIHRKGPDVLLKSFLRAFTADDDVCLVIKDFGGQSVYGGQTMGARIREIAARPGGPEIVHLEEELTEDQMPALYAACDCLVHPYRGEGFGLPVLEAMACGLPVIVTQGGATDDFARPEHVFHIPAERKSIGREVAGLALVGEGWLLEPSLPALVERMKWVVQHGDQARARGQSASEYVRRECTWDKAAAIAMDRARELERKAPQSNRLAEVPPVPMKVKPVVVPEVARVGNLDEAKLHFGRKDHVRAWESAILAMQSRPFHPEGFLLLALIAQAAGDVARARQCAERARRMAPGWKSAQKLLKVLPRQASASRVRLPPWPKALDEENGPRLTVCLIARNEEQFIGQALRSVAEVAAQIVVVDTGSTDATVEIARAAGAEVYHCPWTDDFSAPRNEALRHATGDWILSLDADEELSKEGVAELLKAMRDSKVLAYRLPIFDVGSEANGCHYVPRLFRNAPGAHFTGRVHEQAFSSLEPSRKEWGLANQLGAVRLVHHGYTRALTQGRDKIARNLRLLDLALAETPGDVNLLMNRGLELMRNEQPEAGLASYREAVEALAARKPGEISPELLEVLLTQYSTYLLQAQKLEEVCALLQSPLARASGLSASLHFNLGMALARRGKFQEAAGQMRQCLAKRTQPSLAPANPEVRRSGPYHCLALCLGRLGQTEAEERAYADGLKADPKSRPLRFDFARFLARANRKQEALHVLYQLVAERPLDAEAWQLGGQIALSDPAFAEFAADWTAEAVGRLPGDPVIAAQRAEVLKRAHLAEAVVA